MRVIPRTSWISARLLSGVVSGDSHRLVVVLNHVLNVRTVRIPAEDVREETRAVPPPSGSPT